MGIPETATLSSGTMVTITVAARAVFPYDVSLHEVYARARVQLDEAARDDFAAPGMIEGAVVVFAGVKRRDLR